MTDPALFLGPMLHEFGWTLDDLDRLGAGAAIGHLMECAAQITGGYFSDPGFKDVPEPWNLGFPIADVTEDGACVLGKLEGTGGRISLGSVKEQMLYEVHDPAAYLTPDVTADFSGVEITQAGTDRVSVQGASGHARPEGLKVTVGFAGGFLGEGEISYAGPGAAARARLAGEVIRTRMVELHGCQDPIRVDLLGLGALLPPPALPYTVRALTRSIPGQQRAGPAARAAGVGGGGG